MTINKYICKYTNEILKTPDKVYIFTSNVTGINQGYIDFGYVSI